MKDLTLKQYDILDTLEANFKCKDLDAMIMFAKGVFGSTVIDKDILIAIGNFSNQHANEISLNQNQNSTSSTDSFRFDPTGGAD